MGNGEAPQHDPREHEQHRPEQMRSFCPAAIGAPGKFCGQGEGDYGKGKKQEREDKSGGEMFRPRVIFRKTGEKPKRDKDRKHRAEHGNQSR